MVRPIMLMPLVVGVLIMVKLRLAVKYRAGHGAYVPSVPLRRLIELSQYRRLHWSYKDGWLTLEAY